MKSLLSSARGRLLVLVVFAVLVLVGAIGLLSQTQMFTGSLYHVTVALKDADNAVAGGQIRIAGVPVGNIVDVEPKQGGAVATLALRGEFAPLHEGVTVRVGNRSLVEETYLDIKDGRGTPIPDGGALPSDSVQTSTQVRDVLYSLDPKTRATLATMLRSAGVATSGTHDQTGQLFDGLGRVGREGYTTLQAISNQGEELKRLTRSTAIVLRAMDTGQGDIASLVDSANRLTDATAREKPAIEATMVRLPGVLDSARTASGSLYELSHSLKPIARGLRAAAPDLRDSMHDLPYVAHDLRRLMPDLDRALDRAPGALHKVNRLSHDLRDDLIPNTRDILRDANPMLAFMKDYAPDVAGLVSNFSEVIGYTDENGREVYHAAIVGTNTAVASPINPGNLGHLDYFNPIPKPGTLRNPGPFKGPYPRIEREPR